MKRKQLATYPLHDYRPALQGALSAEPMPRLQEVRTPYFTEPQRWHPSVVAGALKATGR